MAAARRVGVLQTQLAGSIAGSSVQAQSTSAYAVRRAAAAAACRHRGARPQPPLVPTSHGTPAGSCRGLTSR